MTSGRMIVGATPMGKPPKGGPVVQNASFNITGNVAIGDVVGVMSASGSVSAWRITAGNDGSFVINNSGVISVLSAGKLNGLSADTTYSLSVEATNRWGRGSGMGTIIVARGALGGPPPLPAGVTTLAIDGGQNYYANNGFTYATASVTYKLSAIGGTDITYAGWDDPKFFPIGSWLNYIPDQTAANRWLDLGLNVMTAMQSSQFSALSVLTNNGIHGIANSGEIYVSDGGGTGTLAMAGGTFPSIVVGLLTFDEPFAYSQGFSGPLDSKGSATFTGALYGRLANLTSNPFSTTNTSNVVKVHDVGFGLNSIKAGFSGMSAFNNVNLNNAAASPFSITKLARSLGANPLTTNGTTTVTVTDTAHALITGDSVNLAGATAFNGVTANGDFAITFVGVNSYTIQVSPAASGSGSGGGSSIVATDNDYYTVVASTNANATGSGGGASAVAAYNDSAVLHVLSGLTGEIYPQNTSVLSGSGVAAGSYVSAYGGVPNYCGVAGNYYVSPTNQLVYPPVSMSITAPTPIANAVQDARFWWTNLTYQRVAFGDMDQFPSGTILTSDALATPIASPSGTGRWVTRRIDLTGYDFYFLQNSKAVPAQQVHGMSVLYNASPDLTLDQTQRGSHYGDQIDQMRRLQTPNTASWLSSQVANPIVRAGVVTNPTPIVNFIENGGPNGESSTGASYICPYEMNWAIWSSIVHGCRFISYFNTSNGGPGQSSDNFAIAYYSSHPSASFTAGISGTTMTVSGGVTGSISNGMTITSGAAAGTIILWQDMSTGSSGNTGSYTVYPSQTVSSTAMTAAQSISIYDQAKTTNNFIRTLAPVINAQFALGYITTVSPFGYNFPTLSMVVDPGGIDVCAKYYTGPTYSTSGFSVTPDTISPGFYIFASTRNSIRDTQISATFTTADTAATSVTVINEGRTRPISGGVFTDTFDYAWTTHIYRVNH